MLGHYLFRISDKSVGVVTSETRGETPLYLGFVCARKLSAEKGAHSEPVFLVPLSSCLVQWRVMTIFLQYILRFFAGSRSDFLICHVRKKRVSGSTQTYPHLKKFFLFCPWVCPPIIQYGLVRLRRTVQNGISNDNCAMENS